MQHRADLIRKPQVEAAAFRWRDMFLRGAEPPPSARIVGLHYHPWLIVFVVCIGAFIGQLDASIVQLTLPALAKLWNVPLTEVRWVSIGYLLAAVGFMPVFGRICELFGRKLVYLVGFSLFGVSSLLCGLASDVTSLVVFRILQGLGSAMLGANSFAILTKSFDAHQRTYAVGLYTTSMAVGISAGPALGGLLLDSLGWRWVFWINVPICMLAVIAGWLILPRTADAPADRHFDWRGALLLVPSLVFTVLALNQVSVWPIASPAMVLCAVAGLVLLWLFVRHERSARAPLIDLSLFARRQVAAGYVCSTMTNALLYGLFFCMSFSLVNGYQNSASTAGLKLMTVPIALGLTAPLSVYLSKRWGIRKVCVAGMALCASALVLLANLEFSGMPHDAMHVLAFGVFGVGLGLFITPNNNATLDAAPEGKAGQAGVMLIVMRGFGSCTGVSVVSSVMAWSMTHLAGADRPHLFSGRPVIASVESALIILLLFAMICGALSLVRGPAAGTTGEIISDLRR